MQKSLQVCQDSHPFQLHGVCALQVITTLTFKQHVSWDHAIGGRRCPHHVAAARPRWTRGSTHRGWRCRWRRVQVNHECELLLHAAACSPLVTRKRLRCIRVSWLLVGCPVPCCHPPALQRDAISWIRIFLGRAYSLHAQEKSMT